MIPSRKEVAPIILEMLEGGGVLRSEQIQNEIAEHFALTNEERTRKRGRGPHPEYINETAWALVDLQKDGLIRKPDEDEFEYVLTDSGRDAARRRSLGTPIPRRIPRDR